jgi:ferrous-iron efflux pump FieF
MTVTLSASARERSLQIAVGFCLLDVLLIGYAAFSSNSLTILSDLFKESTDLLSVLAAWLTVRAVGRAPDERFTYGIGKLENLVSIGIAVLMTLCGLFILVQAVHHLRNPQPTVGTLPGILVFSIYAGIGFCIWLRNRWLLRQQASAIIASQAKLWFSKALFDALMAASLIVAAVFSDQAWSLYLDPLASLVGVLFLFHAAFAITSSSVGDLLDATLEEHLQLCIVRQLAEHFDDYDQLHRIRTRRSGPKIYIELFLQFNPTLSMGEVQRRIGTICHRIVAAIPGADVTIVPALAPPAQ